MTRETRIGLIVGLMFIVLFGVVLSELGPTHQEPAEQPDRIAGDFYIDAPVMPSAPVRPRHRESPLVARRRAAAQSPAPAPGVQQRRVRPRPTTPVRETARPATRTPRRVVGPTVPPAPSPRRTDRREMTINEFARSRGVPAAGGNSRTYVTRRGDNLTAIARKFYRTPNRKAVMKIYNANRSVLPSPDSLGVGVKIVIPN